MNKFYLIWDNQSNSISKMHMDFEGAKKEAERLIRNHPSKRFTVLVSLETVAVNNLFTWHINNQEGLNDLG